MSAHAMEIPYTVEPRPDTGLTNGKIGIWLFLASEVMLFGALFASYIMLRVGNPAWPKGTTYLNVPLATLNTVILISSSITMVLAWASLVKNDFGKYRLFMGITILCGFGFLGVKYVEYTTKFHHGYFPRTNTFLGIYFTLTGLHMLHVIGGMAVNTYFWGPGAALWKTNRTHFTNRVENAGLFWHLVDLVWIFLFPVLYLL
jgi:cytochrome c oxidase subunit 3